MSKFSITLLVSAWMSFLYTPDQLTQEPEALTPTIFELETWPEPSPPEGDTSKVKKTPNDRQGDPTRQEYVTPLFLGNPGNFKTSYELREDGTGFDIYERVGDVDFRRPSYISFEDYIEYHRESGVRDYFKDQSLASNNENQKGLELNIDIGDVSDIFGGGPVTIRPTGYATLDFSIDRNFTDNPALPQRQQRTTIFNFDQQIQLGVIGQIGEKLRLNANFDTQATFDFENELKLKHTGTEDQILQEIEAGNVSMQVGNSLIQGRQNLFGVKTKLRFGPVYISAIASTERGEVNSVNISGGGAIETPFEKEISEYDMNRHFFMAHYFRSRYEAALRNLPLIQSNIRINRVEVWVEQQGSTRNNRNAVGFLDLGENNRSAGGGNGLVYNAQLTQSADTIYPDNASNNLYSLLRGSEPARTQSTAKSAVEGLPGVSMANTEDFQVLGNMRRLDPNEYTVNNQLGYISLNSPVPTDQVLFIAFNYTVNGQAYQVGEFSDDIPADGLNSNVLWLKMLKSSVLRVSPFPAWDLMMKNIYNIGYGIQRDGFFLDIKYESGTSAGRVNFLPTGAVANRPLIQVVGLDRLTNHTAPGPDNYFDFIEGITMIGDRGLVIFPVLEPFGDNLAARLNNDPEEVEKYVFDALYDDTQQGAVQRFPEKNRFSMEGFYRSSSSSEIPLNTFNLAEGSVTVTAGGRNLIEGQDFTVDYFGGKVTIINQSILTSGQDIQVNYESSSLYNIQTKTLLGSRAEFSPSEDLQLGATVLNLREQPFNQKTILGDEPVNNTLWGLDASLRKESALITKLVDRLPLISTKEKSNINAAAEFAQFIPGAPAVNRNGRDRGFVFLDDFEAAATPFSLQGTQNWRLASFPDGNPNLFNPDAFYDHPLSTNYTRAKLAWYQIDQAFYQRFGIEFPEVDLNNNYTRQVAPNELFPLATRPIGSTIQTTFDLFYVPDVRGPYNYQVNEDRLNPDGTLARPEENWGGIMREIDINNDFEATNVEFLEFWMMDPFMDNPSAPGGEFYINLGLVSEDILSDESLSRENGLPGANDPGNLDSTAWGLIPIGNPPVNAFSNDERDRLAQDIGLDGLNSEDEAIFFQDSVLSKLQSILTPQAFNAIAADPSSDDFLHFRDDFYENQESPILDRYAFFNGLEGNSPAGQDNRRYTVQATNQPDTEDLNRNGSLNFAEQYWEYRIRLHPDSLERGMNYVVDKITTTDVPVRSGPPQTVTWIQFRVPIKAGRAVNNIQNFKTISFMRMYMTDFVEPVITRLTEFQLVATQWLRYNGELAEQGVIVAPTEPPLTDFELGSVSLEENSQKLPFNYQLPPDVIQQAINGNTQAGFLQDERSLVIKATGLKDGDARSIFKNTRNDLRQYNRIRMWVHAEAVDEGLNQSNFDQRGDAKIFMRLGLDNDQNYYEYEIPLTPSDLAAGPGVKENTWLVDNEFDFELALMAVAKAARNSAGTGLIYRHEYFDPETMPEGHRIYVKGTPKLSDVRNIMIGVRNPSDPDRRPISLEVWVNELRLTNFDKSKGWAANANASIKLADLGNVNVSGSYKSAGFGPLDQKLSTRAQEDVLRYDLAANVSLDKLFPSKWGLQMPVYATFGEQRINPIFNPQEADVRTDVLIDALPREEAQAKLQEIQDYRRTRSISFNNWRKIKTRPGGGKGKPGGEGGQKKQISYPWDISNFDFTFAYNEQYARNAVIERRFNTQHRAAVNYRYQFPQVMVKPFQFLNKLKFLKDKIGFVTDWGFSPWPNQISVSINGDRQFEERLMRPTSLFGGEVAPLYSKNFLLNRNYSLNWNLTKNLQINFTANNIARVDEVQGFWETATQQERDSVGSLMDNLLKIGRDPANGHDQLINFGRTTNYTHNLTVAYQLPTAQISWLNWINGQVNYTGSFNWQQAPEIEPAWGGSIGNTQNIQANVRADLNGFYRKFKFIQEILDSKPFEKKEDPKAAKPGARPAPGRKPPAKKTDPDDELPADATAEADTVKKDPFKVLKIVGKELTKLILSVKNADLTYSANNSTILPGYMPRTDNFGVDWNYEDPFTQTLRSQVPPTWGFLLGDQRDIRGLAADNFWISQDTTLSSLFTRNQSGMLTGRVSIEPIKGFRIDLSANRSLNQNESEFFRFDGLTEEYGSFDPQRNGTFTMSYIFANTAFEPVDTSNLARSETFEAFSVIRQIISERYAEANPQTAGDQTYVKGGFRNGYIGSNQDVLITSMLAAYGPLDAQDVELNAFPRLPLPNWSINFNGASSLPFIKKHFNSLTFKHSYRATYTVGTFNNNLRFRDFDGDGYADQPNLLGTENINGNLVEVINYFATDNIQAVQINEQFSPLLGVNLNMKNGLTGQIDYKRGRQMTLNTGNLQMTELKNQDLAVMFGYRKDKLDWHFTFLGRDFHLTNSANFQFRATVRDTREANHTLSADGVGPALPSLFTRGTFNFILSPSIDYVVNTGLNIKLFFERNVNRPYVNNAFNTAFTSGGVQIRFTLGN